MNRLSKERSAYLKHSAYQKIDWYPWSEEAFERAKREDKPVFLSSGAIWCHWCHVMAKECFEEEEVIRLLNENFISIKLDRDERPDIDRRYQHAVNAMGSGGGWPLSVFLTPDKKPFFGGTYFPPEDSNGRPGFKKLLQVISDFYKSKREEVSEYSERLMEFIKPKAAEIADIKESLIDDAIATILSEYDPRNGGFGTAPKFPMPGAMEFLINRHFLSAKEEDSLKAPLSALHSIGYAVRKTMESMARGGFHDHLGGGFHRYSTDEGWIVPHFEKMADDNSWLLRNYIDAYCLFGDEYFREVAEGIIKFVKDVLSDAEGGFYASQDADVTPDDEGGYFTWTNEDFRKVFDDKEYKILSLHLLHERGSMHHGISRKVLFISMDAEAIAEKLGMETTAVTEIINRGKEKLLKERLKRESPFVDRTFYTSLNGMFISSYLKAFRTLKDNYLKDFALKTLDKINKIHFNNRELLHTEGIKGLLDDYVHMIDASIACYEVTGNATYLTQAGRLMGICVEKFWDKDGGGFFDTNEEVLGLRLKGVDDTPHPSANSLGIILLLKLYYMLRTDEYYHYAARALRAFSLRAKDMGIHSGYYYCALDAYFHMITLTLKTSPMSILSDTAVSAFSPYTNIVYGEDRGYVIPCIKGSCYEPISTSYALRDFLRRRHP